MKRKMTPVGKGLILALIAGAIVALYTFWLKPTFFAGTVKESQTIGKITLAEGETIDIPSEVGPLQLPSETPVKSKTPVWTWWGMAWNSQMGMFFANGGAQTTEGSLIDQVGLRMKFERQDMYDAMANELMNFAQDYSEQSKSNPDKIPTGPFKGIQFCSIMADGAPMFLYGLNKNLEKLGTDYRAEIIFSPGRSLGEDAYWAKPEVKEDPQKARGTICATVLRDGDWNLVCQFAAMNGIPINPDPTTYDADAINFMAVNDYIAAANAYINGTQEEREVVKNGKRTGKKNKYVCDSYATWTPGDVNATEAKGGCVRIVSTKDFPSQMVNAFIGIHKFNEDHRTEIKKMIVAVCKGGDYVKKYPDALKYAAKVSVAVYKEQNQGYWMKYYRGATATDAETGAQVECGGSMVHNLADNFNYFGITTGQNIYRSVYKTFGDLDTSLYKELMPTYPPLDKILNLSFLTELSESIGDQQITEGTKTTFAANVTTENTERVSNRGWNIEFALGSAELTPEGKATLNQIYDQAVNAMSLYLSVTGHTDASGDQATNERLSQARAESVKNYLQKKNPTAFPNERFIEVRGYADKTTRRVDIAMNRSTARS